MDLQKFKQLSELDEKIYELKMKNIRYKAQKEVFDTISFDDKELDRLNFVNDFIDLISENLKKMSSLTLALMNQSEVANDQSCVFKLRKELKSVLVEYLQKLLSFTFDDNRDVSRSEQNLQLDQKAKSDEIAPVYDFIIRKLEAKIIKDPNEQKMLNEIADDFRKIYEQLEKFNKVFN